MVSRCSVEVYALVTHLLITHLGFEDSKSGGSQSGLVRPDLSFFVLFGRDLRRPGLSDLSGIVSCDAAAA